MKTQIMQVTPELAKRWLALNTNNRKMSEIVVNGYKNDMLAGKWSLTHQGIAFYDDATLADGQQRLEAVIRSGCTVSFMVTFGVEKKAGADIDVHRARRAVDAIKIGGLADWITKDVVAIVNFLFAASYKKLSPHQIVDYSEKYKDDLQFAIEAMSNTKKYITTAPIMAAVVKASANHCGTRQLFSFCHVLITGFPNSENDIAALRLREYLIDTGKTLGKSADGRKESHMKCQRAIKAFLDGEKIKKLVAPTADLYPIEP